jgi:hypothetical protein
VLSPKRASIGRGKESGFAKDTTASWGTTAADEAGKAADKIRAMADGAANTASNVADQAKGAVGGSH